MTQSNADRIKPLLPTPVGNAHWAGVQKQPLNYSLSQTELEAYQQNGYLILPSVFSEKEIDLFRREDDQITDQII